MTTNLYSIPASRLTNVSCPLLPVLVIVLAFPVTILVDPILTFHVTFEGLYGVSITIFAVTLLPIVVVVVVAACVVVASVVVAWTGAFVGDLDGELVVVVVAKEIDHSFSYEH